MLLTSYGGNRVILAAERLLSSESMVPRISDRWERRVHAAFLEIVHVFRVDL